MTDCLELYWPALVIAGIFCLLIGALIMILMDKFLDWGNDAELRMAHHLNDMDEHTQGLEDRE